MKTIIASITLICTSLATSTMANDIVPWSYSGLNGPSFWGQLTSEYSLCSSGKYQSPINLSGFTDVELPQIIFKYTDTGNQIENNGHIIEINYKHGSSININSHVYELKQTHFHTPSENLINGKSYPMEAQLLNTDKAGEILIISIMFEYGKDNPALQHSWVRLVSKKHSKHLLYKNINPELLLPTNRDYYQYDGSLTMPPCTEGVQWLVMKQPVSASKEQIEKLKKAIHSDNSRPIQMKYSRTILK